MFAKLKSNKIYYGTLLGLIGVICSVLNDATVKLGTEIFSKSQLLLLKSIYSLFWFVVFGFFQNKKILEPIKNKKLMLLRMAIGLTSMVLFLYGMSQTSVALFASCMLLCPLLLSLFAGVVVGEKINIKEQVGLVVALVGACLIVNPFSNTIEVGAIYAIVCAICSAFSILLVKKMVSQGESNRSVVGCYLFGLFVVGLLNVLFFNTDANIFVKDIRGHLILLSSAFFYFSYISLYSKAISMIRASRYSYIEYTDVLWAGIVDYLIWNHVLNYRELTGIGIIILANVYVVMNKDKANG